MHVSTEQSSTHGSFEVKELALDSIPGYVRRVVITENSPELARMHELRIRQQKQEPTKSRAQLSSDWKAYRNLVASIINVAHADLQAAIRYENPRIVSFTHRNRIKVLPNEAFDSAVEFFFGMRKIAVTDERGNIVWDYHSPFNAYCMLMGWSAPRFRGRLLKLFPTLKPVINTVLTEGGWLVAPVAEAS